MKSETFFSLKNWVGRAMGNETFSRAGLTARQKQNAFQSFTNKSTFFMLLLMIYEFSSVGQLAIARQPACCTAARLGFKCDKGRT